MKTFFLRITIVAIFLARLSGQELPDLDKDQLEKISHHLYNVELIGKYNTITGKYTVEEFVEDLAQVDVSTSDFPGTKVDADTPLFLQNLARLALSVRDPETLNNIAEIKGWYGCYAHELSDDRLRAIYPHLGKQGRPSPQEHRDFMAKQAGKSRFAGSIEQLREEHLKPSYLPAWTFWLMAPPSKEGMIMRNRLFEALKKIADESTIPFLSEALKIEVGRVGDRDKNRVMGVFINLIAEISGDEALSALLSINRYAVKNGLNGDDYYQSVSRHIIRRLASRRAYADSLLDPKMKSVNARKGYNEKPEDIPLTDELWKKYKPLLEARLEAKTDETPQADIELIKSALEIMPKG